MCFFQNFTNYKDEILLQNVCDFIEFARWGLEIYKPQDKKNILFWSTSRLVCTSVRPSVRPSTDHSLSPMKLIFGIEGFSPIC